MEPEHEALNETSEQPNEPQWDHASGRSDPHKNLKRRLNYKQRLAELEKENAVYGKPARIKNPSEMKHLRLKIKQAEPHWISRGKGFSNPNR